MDQNKELEPFDLSKSERGRAKSQYVDIQEEEFKATVNSVFTRLSDGFGMDRVVKVPSSLGHYLDNYDGVGFKALVSVVIETAGDLLYSQLADNFLYSVWNMGIYSVGLPKSMEKPVTLNAGSRSYVLLNRLVGDYKDIEKYFFKDVSAFPDRLNSALDISYLYEHEKLKVQEIQQKLDSLKSEYEDKIKSLNQALAERNLRISDLSGQSSGLVNLRAEYQKYRYYHFGIPRPLRYVKLYLGKLFHRLKGSFPMFKRRSN